MTQCELVDDAGAELGEGPLWDHRSDVLHWVDIIGRRVHHFSPTTGALSRDDVPQEPGALGLRAAGGLVAAVTDGFAVLEESTLRMLSDVEGDRQGSRMNDGACDPLGRFWASTMDRNARPGAGTLYRLDADHHVTPVLTGLTIGNGLAFSADLARMWFIDSATHGVDSLELDAGGPVPGSRRRLVTIDDGLPDGMALAADGTLFVAVWGGWSVRAFDAGGREVDRIPVPAAQVTSCALGGPGLTDLYISTARKGLGSADLTDQPHAGGLFRAHVDNVGLPADLWLG